MRPEASGLVRWYTDSKPVAFFISGLVYPCRRDRLVVATTAGR